MAGEATWWAPGKILVGLRAPLLSAALVFLFLAVVMPLGAAPKQKEEPPVDPSTGEKVEVRVDRGSEVRINLKGIVFPGNVAEFEIVRPPKHGALKLAGRTKDTAIYVYRHDGKAAGRDTFRWKLKTGPGKAWGYQEGRIEIVEPPTKLHVGSEELDFGEVFIGAEARREVSVSNAGGGVLGVRLQTGAPWVLDGNESEVSLPSGKSRKVVLVYRPLAGGENKGVLEIQSGDGGVAKVTLFGTARYKFEAPPRITFQQEALPAERLFQVKNLVDEPLEMALVLPEPLVGEKKLVLTPLGVATMRLEVPPVRFVKNKVTVEIRQGEAVFPIEVDLPPPPPLLEWRDGPMRDLGAKPAGQNLSITALMRNSSPRAARVALRLEGEGLRFAGDAPAEITLPPTEHCELKLEWALPEQAGVARGAIVASSGGLESRCDLSVLVEPVVIPKQVHAPLVQATPTPEPPKKSPFKKLTKEESAALDRFLPRNIRYRLEPAGSTATAVVTWSLNRGVSGEGMRVERFVARRPELFASNPLEKRLKVPGELPEPALKAEWIEVPPDEARMRRLEDGSWEARVPGLEEGFHRVRLLVPQPGTKNFHGNDFVVEVGAIPRSAALKWGLGAVAGVLLFYLLRQRFRRSW